MFKALLFTFVVLPFVDLYLLVLIGQQVGFWPTLGLVLAAGLIGSFLAKKEGMRVLRRWQESMARGQVPQEGLLSGALVFAGGVLLVIPGVLTDVLGLFLLFPPTRRLVAGLVRRRLERGMADGTVRVTTFQSGSFSEGPFTPPESDEPFASRPSRPSLNRGDEVDAEFTEEDGR